MKKSVRKLLDGIVDYAGLFPPAGLDMQPVVRNYASYRQSLHRWMLGRLVVPVARFGEFVEHAADINDDVWYLSALAGADGDGERIARFNSDYQGRFVVDSVELKAEAPAAVSVAVADMPDDATVFVELPSQSDPLAWVEAVAECGACAKIRTGGVTVNMFPAADAIARFILRCRDAGVAFKATAGLHHPMHADYRLTYADDSDSGTMHGFLNVFLAAAMARYGARQEHVERVLNTTDAADFVFEDEWVQVLDHRFTVADLEATRSFARSFGSCSFDEPAGDLKGLGVL